MQSEAELKKAIRISVCVVTHDRPDLLEQLLASLKDSEIPQELHQILVVENGRSSQSGEVCKRFSSSIPIRFEQISDSAKSSALNHALKIIEDGFLLFIDDDATPCRKWLTAYRDAISSAPSGFYFGGPIQPKYDKRPANWLIRFLPASARGFTYTDIEKAPERSTAFLGFNWAADAQSLKRVGGFDLNFGPGTQTGLGEETLAQQNLLKLGQKSKFVSDALVEHYVPPQRCSPGWCLKRAKKGAMNAGIFHADYCRQNQKTPTPLRSSIRHGWKRLSRNCTPIVPVFPILFLFGLCHSFAVGSGFYRGVRIGLNKDGQVA